MPSAKKKSLDAYGKKRDFGKTPEPSGKKRGKRSKEPVFVIQKHDSSTLHYDFRIEADGVLKSWAVPKGPSTDTSVKRLAVPTEDHPMEYGDFEGTIPEGEYGGGTVMVWDKGTYANLKVNADGKPVPVAKQIEDGHATIWLKGEKLKGGYALIRTGKPPKARWLLVKMDDAEADARRNPVSTEKKSALTGRTIKEIADAAKGK